ncbi:MAG: right-handed parallel beta-helix repeat-containing protein, partial [Phenylobacterium sp.]|nr:right-handed parallel beta-helix repeat-containing protein [Phenylobacterium sp.]
KVDGSLDGDAKNDTGGLQIRSSSNVTVTNSEFVQLNNGIGHLDSKGLKLTNNYIHELSEDGIRGGGSSDVLVSGNYFTDFERRSEGDHPDAIQFWTTNTTASASNITVTGNVITRGSGDAVQGIFFRDQSGGDLPYLNVSISNNLVVGGLTIGIRVNGAKGVTISDNVVAGLPDQLSKISTLQVEEATLSNNVATSYTVESGSEINDRTIASPMDGGLALQRAWLASNSGGGLAKTQGELQVMAVGGTALKVAVGETPLKIVNAGSLTSSVLDAAANRALAEINAELAKVVRMTGTDGADKLTADGIHNSILYGGAGDDVLSGKAGMSHNTLVGGLGDDKYNVYSENDVIVEDEDGGYDLVNAYADYTLADNVEQLRLQGAARYGGGNSLDNKIAGGAGDDEIRGFGGDDQLSGGSGGNDRLYGGDGNDTLSGNDGDDTLSGDAGNDKLNGDTGSDSLSGGAGSDTLEGGAGDDTLSGGAGADVFIFRNGDVSMTGDRILDFSHAEGDRINLQPIDANTNLAGDQKFAFIGTSAFHKTAGELRMDISGGVTHVYGDTNGDGVADFHLILPGAGTLVAADFVL